LLLGDGTGGFRPGPHSPFVTNAKPHPHGVVVGHFCGKDEPLDAVIDSWGSEEVELLIGDGKGNLRNGPMFPAGPGSDMPLRSSDLNGDGVPDIVIPDPAIGHWNANIVAVLLGNGRCGFNTSPGSPFPGGAVPWSVAVGDINNVSSPVKRSRVHQSERLVSRSSLKVAFWECSKRSCSKRRLAASASREVGSAHHIRHARIVTIS